MASLPSGTVTFLLTDIEGSTQLWDAFPDDMRVAVGLHDTLIAEAVARHGGRVIKNTGDGLFAAFDAADGAVGAAVAAQRAMAGADWPSVVGTLGVRMALHTAAIQPSGGDYHGPDVNRVARIEAAGHGGQILLSGATRALIARSIPDGATIVDLGTHVLRGIAEPEHIYELAIDGLRAGFPPLRTGSAIEGRLPVFSTSFIGRRHDIDELAHMLRDPDRRLVTLVGAGGIGKTRLAVEAAHSASVGDGVTAHFFSLEGISRSSDVVKALGDSIGFTFDIHLSAQVPEKRQLFDRLATHPLLLVLDNLEHLDDIADLISEMLAEIPAMTILATSRRPLELSAEWRYRVAGLDDGSLDDAVALFSDRARRAGASIDLDSVEGSAVSAICRRLGGMPLAIEMAAAWTTVLTPSAVLEEVERDLDFLEASSRDMPDRHRSMRAVFDHSWRRLPEELQNGYARLSVFVAPFDRAAALAVAGMSIGDLMELSKQSLVYRPNLGRFALHPLLRDFAAGKLGDDGLGVQDRYARYYLAFLTERAAALQGSVEQMEIRDEIAAELDHVRAVSDHWIDHLSDAEVTAAVRILNEFYFQHSWVDQKVHLGRMVRTMEETAGTSVLEREAYLWAVVLLAVTESSFSTPDVMADLLASVEAPWRERGGAGLAAWFFGRGIELALRGDYEASIEPYEEASRSSADLTPLLDAQIAAWLGWSQLQSGRTEMATATFDAGLTRATAANHYLGRAFLLSKYGLAADAAGEHDRAAQFHHEGREIFVKAGDLGGQGYTLSRLSWTHYLLGEYETARRYAIEGLESFEQINHRWGIAVSYGRMGLAEIELGMLASAAEHFVACLTEAIDAGLVDQQHYAVIGIGRTLVKAGRYAEAVPLLTFEAGIEENPYLEFAVAGLEQIPPEEKVAGDVGEIDLDAAMGLCRRAAERLVVTS